MKYLKKFENYTEYEEAKQNLILPNVSLCAQENEVYYKPYVDPYNGHAYVDLGLPSGTLWATMNVGASSETDYGLYFAWGETEGYTADQVSGTAFGWADYKWTEDKGSTMSKYNATDHKTVLDLEDDAVAANWGGDWHMPTAEQFQELSNTEYCTNIWTAVNGVNGCLFTSKENGNKLFIPAAGYAKVGSMKDIGNSGYVWGSSHYSSNVKYGHYLLASSHVVGMNNDNRYYGYTVRGVVG